MTQEDFTTTTDRELQLLVDHGTTPTVRDAARVELARRRDMDAAPEDRGIHFEAGRLVVECRLTHRHATWLERMLAGGEYEPGEEPVGLVVARTLGGFTECTALVMAGLCYCHDEDGNVFAISAEKRELATAVAAVLRGGR